MFIDRAEVTSWDRAEWPFTVPAVRALAENGIDFLEPVTFFVGENGSGKSTIVEAIAQSFGLDTRGGHGGRKYEIQGPRDPLGTVLHLSPHIWIHKQVKSFFLRAETAFNTFNEVSSYGDHDAAEISHGESFLQVFEGRFKVGGLYILDEPETPLSFRSCLRLMSVLHEVAQAGGQVICATHSPMLTALPGAQIIELCDDGLVQRTWEDLDITRSWRDFLGSPESYLRHLLG
jgi:predicted ATPase